MEMVMVVVVIEGLEAGAPATESSEHFYDVNRWLEALPNGCILSNFHYLGVGT